MPPQGPILVCLHVFQLSRHSLLCRAEVVDGEVKVQGPESGTAPGPGENGLTQPTEDFQVPTQLRQQYIEVQLSLSMSFVPVLLSHDLLSTLPAALLHNRMAVGCSVHVYMCPKATCLLAEA